MPPDLAPLHLEVVMAALNPPEDERLAALPLPLKHLGVECDVGRDQLQDAADRVLAHVRVRSDQRPFSRSQFAVLEVGTIVCAAGRTTPVISSQKEEHQASLFLCYAGRPHYREGRLWLPLRPGSILVNPNHGGYYRTCYSSSLCFQVQRQALRRTILAMGGDVIDRVMEDPEVWGVDPLCTGGKLFDLFGFIDQLLARDRSLPSALGLDDQIYRILALLILGRAGKTPLLQRRAQARHVCLGRFDALIDYIRTDPARVLTLTDLEEQSHYSARHLQTLFREKFDCTPMQFVRRQRLQLALEKLEAAGPGDTVTRIARACGYRYVSNFSVDFHRQFGLPPSQILRGGGRVGCDNHVIGTPVGLG